MRFYHLADLHLGRQLYQYSLIEEQRNLLENVIAQVKKQPVDAVLISGDVYDKPIPSAEAVALFNDFLSGLKQVCPSLAILIIAGNHDSGTRLEFAKELLKDSNLYFCGSFPQNENEMIQKVILKDEFGDVNFYLLPFLRPAYVRHLTQLEKATTQEALQAMIQRENIDSTQRNVLLTHQFYTWSQAETLICDSESMSLGGLDNVDVSVVENFDYVAMGHVHGSQRIKQDYFRYSGSLLKYSVSEVNHHKSMPFVTLSEKGKVDIELIPFLPHHDLISIKGTLKAILQMDKSEEYTSITLTDTDDVMLVREKLLEMFPRLLEINLSQDKLQKLMDEEEIKLIAASPLEAFKEFYAQSYGESMSEAELDYLEKIMAKVDHKEAS